MGDISSKERIDRLDANPFLDGPGQYLIKTLAQEIVAVKQFALIFGDSVDAYKRMDYPIRAFPALRIYNNAETKEAESWFVTGDILADVIWPASIRRPETQQLPDIIAAALFQQFRRTPFFNAVSLKVPGLNELGKRITVDKSLGYQVDDDEIVPLTQFTINFRLDLRAWDSYLESVNRTKDDPFEQTLSDLDGIALQIQGLRDAEVEVTLDDTED